MSAETRKAQDAATRIIAVCDGIVAEGEESFVADVQAQWAAEMGLIRIDEGVAEIPEPVRQRFAEQRGVRSSPCETSPPTSTTISIRTASGGR